MRINNMTLKEFKELLNDLPEEYNNWTIACCGYSNFWLHPRADEKAIIMDTEENID